IEIAGGIDVLGRKHQKSVQIAWEEVLAAQPEVIVLALCGYNATRSEHDLEILRTYPGFATLPASRSNRIHPVDAIAYFSRPGPRVIDSLELLAGILQPQNFPQFRIG
ncbi:MAG: cobalamin-binding protein, partial [Bryobacteraceae bacterium]